MAHLCLQLMLSPEWWQTRYPMPFPSRSQLAAAATVLMLAHVWTMEVDFKWHLQMRPFAYVIFPRWTLGSEAEHYWQALREFFLEVKTQNRQKEVNFL